MWLPTVTFWAPKSQLLGSLLAPFGHLRALWAPFWPQSAYTKAATQPDDKKLEKPGSQNLGLAARGLGCGALVKVPIPRKASLNTRENANPAKQRKPGPVGKGIF